MPIFHPVVAWPEENLPRRVPVVPLTVVRIDKTGPSGSPNQTIWFFFFRAEAFGSCSFRVLTHFGDSVGEVTTSST
jgi:hypothetical protein